MNSSTPISFHHHQQQSTQLPIQTLSEFIDSHPPQSNISSTNTLPTTTTFQTTPKQSINMHTRRHNATVTKTTKPTLSKLLLLPLYNAYTHTEEHPANKPPVTRLRGRNANTRTVKTTTTRHPAGHVGGTTTHTPAARRSGWGRNRRVAHTTTPVVHHRRKTSIGDKISGAMLKLKGSLTHRPAVKVCFHSSESH